MRTSAIRALGAFALFACAALQTGATHAAYQKIYSFEGGAKGAYPGSKLVAGPGGVLYGFTSNGGDSSGTPGKCPSTFQGCGTIFKLSPPTAARPTWKHDVIHTFARQADGFSPRTLILGAGGKLYGTTTLGGICTASTSSGCGVFFELAPEGGGVFTYKVVHRFKGGATGGHSPTGELVFDKVANLIYGITTYGGKNSKCSGSFGCGTVYRMTPPATNGGAWTFRILHKFTGVGASGGDNPTSIALSGNILYGTTLAGGSTNRGTVFKLKLSGAADTRAEREFLVLYNFLGDALSGQQPGELAIDQLRARDRLWVLLRCTGKGDSQVIRFDMPATGNQPPRRHIIIKVPGDKQLSPGAGIHLTDFNAGAARRVIMQVMGKPGDGDPALGALLGADDGAEAGTWTVTPLHRFQGGTDGAQPNGAMTEVRKGGVREFYGATIVGGSNGVGTIYRYR